MRFINIATEEENQDKEKANPESVDLNPNEAEKAKEAVENQDSTETKRVLQVANYKEELAIILASNQDDDSSENQDEQPAEKPDTNTEDNPDDASDDEVKKENTTEEDSEEEEAPDPTTEMGEADDSKSDEEVAQEQFIVQGYKMASEAIDSMYEMSKYHGIVKRSSELGGINKQTAKIIATAFEHHCEKTGFNNKEIIPALESFNSFTNSVVSTKQLNVAIENFLETVWEAIKKFFKSIWNWIMDLLSGKKKVSNSVDYPQTLKERDASVKVLLEENDKVAKRLENVIALREKDVKRFGEEKDAENKKKLEKQELARNISSAVYKSTDKGTIAELSFNARDIGNTVVAACAFTEKANKIFADIIGNSEAGHILPLETLCINKNSIPNINFDKVTRLDKSSVIEAITDEIVAGAAVRYVFAGDDVKTNNKISTSAKIIQELGTQGFKVVAYKHKGNFPINVPKIDLNDISTLAEIVANIDKCYTKLSELQELLMALASIVKDISDSKQPDTWTNLKQEEITLLKAQLTFVGAFEGNLVGGYKSFNDLANNYKNGYSKLLKTLA